MKRLLMTLVFVGALALQTGVMAKGQWQYHYADQPTTVAAVDHEESGC